MLKRSHGKEEKENYIWRARRWTEEQKKRFHYPPYRAGRGCCVTTLKKNVSSSNRDPCVTGGTRREIEPEKGFGRKELTRKVKKNNKKFHYS